MSLIKVNKSVNNPFNSLVDEFFNSSISELLGAENTITKPAVNIEESDDEIKISVATPGLDKKDIDIQIKNGTVEISGKKEEEHTEESDSFTRREFNFSSFSRSFQLPENIKEEEIAAKYENGVLELAIPKIPEAELKVSKTISIG